MEATRLKTVWCLLLLFTCVQKTTPRNGVSLSKRQADPEGGITKIFSSNPKKDVNEEAFSVEFSGEDYNMLVSLLLDAKNEFLKLQMNPPSNSRSLDVNTTDVADAAPVDVHPVVDENAADAVPEEEDPGLKSAVTENIYFNPMTPDPGVARPLEQLLTARDRKANFQQKLKVTVTPVTDAPVSTEPASETPQGVAFFEGDPAADVTLKAAEPTPCIPRPVHVQLAYPPVPPPLLYSPTYVPYSVPPDGYVYPQVYYPPDSEFPYPPEATAPPPGYYPPVSDNLAPQNRTEVERSSMDASFKSGECISYFCSAIVCTAWECTSEPCTSGICVAKRCEQWSCDAWSNSSLTRVQDADWVSQPPEAQYYDPLNGV